MPRDEPDLEAVIAERDRQRQERYAARAAVAAEKAQGTSLERAKLAALKAVADRNPGGSLPGFLDRVSAKLGGTRFERPMTDALENEAVLTEPLIVMPLAIYLPPPLPPHSGNVAALQLSDTLGYIVSLAGLRCFTTMSLVCRAWRDEVDAKAREWGVLTYVKSVGGGFGKRKAQLDTPTWLCTLPVRDNLLNQTSLSLAIVDSCNFRLSVMRFDGTVSRVLSRIGVESSADPLLELSSQPSSLCFHAESNSVYVVATVGASDRRLLRYALPDFRLLGGSSEGMGAVELDAPEGMTCCNDLVFIVDSARHRIVTYDAKTLKYIGYSGGYSDRRSRWHHRSGEPIFTSPYDIVSCDGELFVSDTHNDRVQILAAQHPCRWIGVIGQSGHGPGQFTYPRGLAIARKLLYVCEERQVQVFTLNGEPRMIMPIHEACGLCGICSDGRRVFVADMDKHKVHVLRLMNERKAASHTARESMEARLRQQLTGGGESNSSGGKDCTAAAAAAAAAAASEETAGAQERRAKESQRDRVLQRVASGGNAKIHRVLGLPATAPRSEVMQAVRLALRVLHPDRSMNLPLKGTQKGKQIEAAFKRVNNLKDDL